MNASGIYIRVLFMLLLCCCKSGDTETGQTTPKTTTDVTEAIDASTVPDADDVAKDIVLDTNEPSDAPDDESDASEDAKLKSDASEKDALEEDIGVAEDTVADLDTQSTADSNGDAGSIADKCFSAISDPTEISPNYDQFKPTVGTHCKGTNHQEITDVEKVVFLGDSVTVGTPNLEYLLSIQNEHFYRNKLAEWLAKHFDLDRGDDWGWGVWKSYDYFKGSGAQLESGDFKHCARWGARTDDLLEGHNQVGSCFSDKGSDKKTLVVFTMGGNDIAAINKKGGDASAEEVAAGYPKAWQTAKDTIKYLEEAVVWLKDPKRFSNGSFIVFANPFEFTDGTGKIDSCKPQLKIGDWDLAQSDLKLAELVGFKPWEKAEVQTEIVVWLLEEYMRIAVDYQVDMVWMLEGFCGHGFVATGPNADPEARCYLGPDTPIWFDVTCYHPNTKGHDGIFEMFKAVIEE